jgi:hypothetical protein
VGKGGPDISISHGMSAAFAHAVGAIRVRKGGPCHRAATRRLSHLCTPFYGAFCQALCFGLSYFLCCFAVSLFDPGGVSSSRPAWPCGRHAQEPSRLAVAVEIPQTIRAVALPMTVNRLAIGVGTCFDCGRCGRWAAFLLGARTCHRLGWRPSRQREISVKYNSELPAGRADVL